MIPPQRKSHRLKNFDYASYGYYYITICTKNKELLLSSIKELSQYDSGNYNKELYKKTVIVPTPLGEKVLECWHNIERLNQNVTITDFVMMPNHIHGVIALKNNDKITSFEKDHSFDILEQKNRRSVQGLIKDFKSVTTRYYKSTYNSKDSLWQASFYDEIVRNKEHYERIRRYIYENPYKWSFDELFCHQ